MFQDTRPADLDADGQSGPWTEFRVQHPAERLPLLRQLRDAAVPVSLSMPGGAALRTQLWSLDEARERLSFSVDPSDPQLPALVQDDEAVAVAYLDSVKLQFDVHALCLVHALNAAALQCALPRDIYRFQRRGAFRVRPPERHTPTATLRHPSMPEMALRLRVLDISIGGCALWLPNDVPPLQPGTVLGQVDVQLDAETRFDAAMTLQHVSAIGADERGARIGCEWRPLSGAANRALQRWIDRTQKRRRLLSL
jgi:c-di-GMP-binding flagellar brake protein YcgR